MLWSEKRMDRFFKEINKQKAWFAAQKFRNSTFQICRRYAVKLWYFCFRLRHCENHTTAQRDCTGNTASWLPVITPLRRRFPDEDVLLSLPATLDRWYHRMGRRPLGSGPIGPRKVRQLIWTNDGECVSTRILWGGEWGGTSGNSTVTDCGCCVHEGGVHFKASFNQYSSVTHFTTSKGPWVQKEEVREGAEIPFCGSWDFFPALT